MTTRHRAAAIAVALVTIVVGLSGASTASARLVDSSEAAVTGVQCLQTTVPALSGLTGTGAVVLAVRLPGSGDRVEALVLARGATWRSSDPGCGAQWIGVVERPAFVLVPKGSAIVTQRGDQQLVWGAREVRDSLTGSAGLVPGGAGMPIVSVRTAAEVLGSYNSCRDCSLARGTRITFTTAAPSDVRFAYDLSGASLAGCTLIGRLAGYNLSGADLKGADVRSADLSGADLRAANLSGVNLSGLKLVSADLRGADLTGDSLAGANLTAANLSGHSLVGADLRGARLTGANLNGANLNRADLSGANLVSAAIDLAAPPKGTQLQEANLSGADLSGLNLTRARLRADNFNGANLTDVNLQFAFLADTSFVKTDVTRANLSDSDLTGAQLTRLRYVAPPRLSDVLVGCGGNLDCSVQAESKCTVIRDSDLLRTGFSIRAFRSGATLRNGPRVGCEQVQLAPQTQLPLRTLAAGKLLVKQRKGPDFADAQFAAARHDRSALAGADLQGAQLNGVKFVGLPVDLQRTDLRGASLRGAEFELAKLAGAKFNDADLEGASFVSADLAATDDLKGASFAGDKTNLKNADFVGADVSGASFQNANISGAAFNQVLARGTNFSSVIATNTSFTGAHIFNGRAFEGARQLQGVNFSTAVLAGDANTGGFNLTHADLREAKFTATQCVACNFTESDLDRADFSGSFLPGLVISNARIQGANLAGAWLFCGDPSNTQCQRVPGDTPKWLWPLALGAGEGSLQARFTVGDIRGGTFSSVSTCPSGRKPSPATGCQNELRPPGDVLTLPLPCSAAGRDVCPANSRTLAKIGVGEPLAIAAADPPDWATAFRAGGYFVASSDATIVRVQNGERHDVVGAAGKRCTNVIVGCGLGGRAGDARLVDPIDVAVGLRGSLYIADAGLHRVLRIDPEEGQPTAGAGGTIVSVAGNGRTCAVGACDHKDKLATDAALLGPYGVWADPEGNVFIADGRAGIREIDSRGVLVTVIGEHTEYDFRGVVGDAEGNLYATTANPDYLVKIDVAQHTVTRVAGTGISGYNGNTSSIGTPLKGTQVQLDGPSGPSVAPNGHVVFADSANGLIRAYVPRTGRVVKLGGLAPGTEPADGPMTADNTKLDDPLDAVVTREGRVVVADSGSSSLLLLAPPE